MLVNVSYQLPLGGPPEIEQWCTVNHSLFPVMLSRLREGVLTREKIERRQSLLGHCPLLSCLMQSTQWWVNISTWISCYIHQYMDILLHLALWRSGNIPFLHALTSLSVCN